MTLPAAYLQVLPVATGTTYVNAVGTIHWSVSRPPYSQPHNVTDRRRGGPGSGPQRPPPHAKHVGGDEGVGGHVGIDGVTDLPPTIERHRVRHSRQRPRDPATVEEAKGHR
jgi:hypothetical protein